MTVSPITVPNMMHLFSRIFTLFFTLPSLVSKKRKKIRKCCFLKKYVHLVKVHKRGDTTILKINEACFILCINDRERAWHIINCLVQHDHHRKSKKISVLPTFSQNWFHVKISTLYGYLKPIRWRNLLIRKSSKPLTS